MASAPSPVARGPRDLKRGDVVDGYEIDYRIGRGPTGVTYKAMCRATGDLVALKVLDRPLHHDDAGLTARLMDVTASQPNLGRVVCGGTIDARHPYQVRRLLFGVPWSRWIRGRRAAPGAREVALAAAELAGALGVLHRAGVVHGNVHDNNIHVVEKDGRTRAILLDAGLCPSDGERKRDAFARDVQMLAATVRDALAFTASPDETAQDAACRRFLEHHLERTERGAPALEDPDELAVLLLDAADRRVNEARTPPRGWLFWSGLATVVAVAGAAATYVLG